MHSFNRLQVIILICSAAFLSPSCQPDNSSGSNTNVSRNQYARSTEGMVASAHPLATAAGKKILEEGGNAVDAAVATAFALAVVEPAMSGLGGRLQAIVRTENGEIHGVDATTQAPTTYNQETAPQAQYGYAVIGIPGTVAGLVKLNKQYGSMPLARLMAPAIHYAEEGFYQLPQMALMQSSVRKQLLEFDGSKQYFILPHDTLTYGPENLLVQADLANTLKMIAEKGPDIFYKGEIAKRMVEDVSSHGGVLTMESLANYEALDAKVLKGSYRGNDVYGLWIPSFGAITIEILQILENLPMNEFSEAEWASAVYQACKIAYEDRYNQKTIDDGNHLISKQYATEQAARIHIGEAIEASSDNLPPELLGWQANPGHTTHLSVADKNGMIVSLTQSLGPLMGSRVATPGLGFLYAATLGGYLGPFEPGQRAASHISPMILTKQGEPLMGLGAAGGSRINTAIVQAISRIIDRDMNLADALKAPRVHPSEDGVLVEIPDSLAWHPEDLQFLKDNGFLIEEVKEPFRFGRVHMVMRVGDEWVGAADPDGEGSADGPIK